MDTSSNDDGDSVLTLRGKLDSAAARSLRDDTIGLPPGPISIDAREVTHIGALCLQILLLLARDARKAARPVSLLGSSDGFRTALEDMGVSLDDVTNKVKV